MGGLITRDELLVSRDEEVEKEEENKEKEHSPNCFHSKIKLTFKSKTTWIIIPLGGS